MSHQISRRQTLAMLAVGTASAVAAGCSPLRSGASDQFILRFSHVTATSTPKGQAAAWFKQELERRTQDRIRVEVYPNSELYGDKDEMQALQSNSVQMLAPASAKFTTVAPALQSLDLPFLVDGLADVPNVVAKESEVGKAIYENKDLESKGMKVVGLWDSGMKQIHSNNETRQPSDMRGRKYRIQPSDILRTQFDKWGGTPTPMAFAEVYGGLQQGVIDGGENNYPNIHSQKMHTVQKFITELNHGYIGYVQVLNKDWFDRLPHELKLVVEATCADTEEYNRKVSQEANEKAKRSIEEAGTTNIFVPNKAERDEFKKLVVPAVYEQYRPTLGSRVVDELLSNQR